MSTTTMRLGAPRRRWPLIAIAVVVGLAVLFTVLSGFAIDVLWFREIGQEQVFWTTLGTKVLLGLAFGLVFAVLLFVNLAIARRLRPDVIRSRPTRSARADARRLRPVPALSCPSVPRPRAGRGDRGLGALAAFLLWRHGASVRSAPPTPCSAATWGTTSSPCRGCGSSRAGCSRRSSASRC